MLVPEAPLDAYRSDLARDKSREDFGGADTVWLLTAHCLSRISRSSVQDLLALGVQCAAALREFTEPSADGPPVPNAEIADLLLVVEGLGKLQHTAGTDVLARGVRGMATRMREAGALSMAYTTVALTRRIVGSATDLERGLLAADQALIARFLGDLDAAEELYGASEAIGKHANDLTILSRTYIGRGVIDRRRGNYPRSRIFFERALELAETMQSRDLRRLAHQGLTICHAIAKNFDRGLQHGWSTWQLSDGDSRHESDALTNLAQLCLDAGFPEAALRAYAGLLSRALTANTALSALGGVAIAAARAGEREVLARASTEIGSRVSASGLPYENAQALYHLATAFAVVGDEARRDEFLAKTRKIAKARGFFELMHKTDPQIFNEAVQVRVSTTALTPSSKDVVTSLTDFEVGEAAGVLLLSR